MQMNGLIPSAWIDDVYAAALGDQRWETVLDGLRSCVGVRMVTLLSFDDAARVPAIEQAAGDDASWVAACYHTYNTEFYRYDPVVPVAARLAGGPLVRGRQAPVRAPAPARSIRNSFTLSSRRHFGPVHPSQRAGRIPQRGAASNRRGCPTISARDRKHGDAHQPCAAIQARIGGLEARVAPPNRRSMRCRCPSSCSARSELRYESRGRSADRGGTGAAGRERAIRAGRLRRRCAMAARVRAAGLLLRHAQRANRCRWR